MKRLAPPPSRKASRLTALGLALATCAVRCACAEPTPPASCAPELESAAQALAEGRIEPAAAGFEAVAADPSLPGFARSLALLGLAEAHLARGDHGAAVATWQRLAADRTLPQLHLDRAARRIDALAAHDDAAAACRAELPDLPAPAATFHVAPDGDDAGDGTANGPFRTLDRARAAVRALKRAGGSRLAPGGVQVILAGGTYPVTQTLALEPEDSGVAGAPIVYRAASGQTPVLAGGLRIKGWRPVTDPEALDRLSPPARDRVLEADLTGIDAADWGDPTAPANGTSIAARPESTGCRRTGRRRPRPRPSSACSTGPSSSCATPGTSFFWH